MRPVARLCALTAAAALAFTLTGCASDTTTATTDPYGWTAEGSLPTGTIGEGANGPAQTGDGFATPTGSVTDITSAIIRPFGGAATIGDVTVTVTAPTAFVPTASAYPSTAAGKKAAAVKITLRNNGKGAVRPYDYSLAASLRDRELGTIHDYDQGAGSSPGVSLLPGSELSWLVVFDAAPDAPGLVVQGSDLAGVFAYWHAG